MKFAILSLVMGLVIACSSPEEREVKWGLSYAKNKDFKSALSAFDRAILRNPDSPFALTAAREGSRIALLDLKDFKKAVEYLHLLVLLSKDQLERASAQKQLAVIYFDELADYTKAIEELNRLLSTTLEPAEKTKFRLKLAKAYYFTNNFSQAESEAGDFLKNEKDEDSIFQMMVLRGNIFLAKKDMPNAIEAFRDILKKFPEKAVKENAAITLAVAYEEMKDYKSAISVFEQMKPYHPMPEYIDLRIKRLLLEIKNQPGAKGLRKK